jgi:hypothetical protein
MSRSRRLWSEHKPTPELAVREVNTNPHRSWLSVKWTQTRTGVGCPWSEHKPTPEMAVREVNTNPHRSWLSVKWTQTRTGVGCPWSEHKPAPEFAVCEVNTNPHRSWLSVKWTQTRTGIRCPWSEHKPAPELAVREVNTNPHRSSLSVPQLTRLVHGFSQWRHGVRAQVNRVGFVVDKVALRQDYLRVFRIFPVNILAPHLHIHPCTIRGIDNRTVSGRSSIETSSHPTATIIITIHKKQAVLKSIR